MAFRDKISQILSIRESPHRIALAFSVGIFIGMSPLLGIHTLLGIAVAWQFRLNKLVTLVGVYVTNPWTIIPIYTFGTWLGAKLLGVRHLLPDIDWSHLTFMGFINDFRHLLMPFVVGTTFVGTISAIAGYALIYHSVKKARG